MAKRLRKHRNNFENSAAAGSGITMLKLLPSLVTLVALCFGLISIRYALDDKFEIAAALIIIAAILDGLDGRIARYLNSVSEFGAQIDSLADLINFGIAPALLMYLWSFNELPYGGLGWGIVLVYVCCAAIRLARFNAQISDVVKDERLQNFIVGLPMPAAAALLILPLLYSFEILDTYHIPPFMVAGYTLLLSFLMISRVPIFTGKKIKIEPRLVAPLLVVIGVIFAGSILEPWVVIPLVFSVGLVFIPIGTLLFYRKVF